MLHSGTAQCGEYRVGYLLPGHACILYGYEALWPQGRVPQRTRSTLAPGAQELLRFVRGRGWSPSACLVPTGVLRYKLLCCAELGSVPSLPRCPTSALRTAVLTPHCATAGATHSARRCSLRCLGLGCGWAAALGWGSDGWATLVGRADLFGDGEAEPT